MQQSGGAESTESDHVEVNQYDLSETGSLFLAVVETAAGLTDYDEYEFPALEESIDLESLESVIRSAQANGTRTSGFVEFDHRGLRIQIHLNGMIYAERVE